MDVLKLDDAANHINILPYSVHADRSKELAQRLTEKGWMREVLRLVEFVPIAFLQ